MRLTLHIFKKDARRLWWEIAVTLGLLAYLSHMDANRADYIPSSMEGLMNLVLPAAWAYLIAMLVHQEALVGDRQFWLTRPHPRSVLLAAKILFVLTFIHLPAVIADALIVQTRGFSPFSYIPVLLQKQVVLALAVTFPAVALAAVTKNLAQFALAAIICAVPGFLLPANFTTPWIRVDEVRSNLVLLVAGLGAVAVIVLQYSRTVTLWSRLIGVSAVSAALLIAGYLPQAQSAAIRCGGGQPLSITLTSHSEPMPAYLQSSPPSWVTAIVPVVVSGVPDSSTVIFEPVHFEIIEPSGGRWVMPERRVAMTGPPPPRPLVFASLTMSPEKNSGWWVISIDKSIYARVASQRIRLRGAFTNSLYTPGRVGEMTAPAHDGVQETRMLQGIGRCSASIATNNYSYSGADLLKVMCESPRPIPRPTRVDLFSSRSGRRWQHGLGDSGMHVWYPTQTWLSPVNRRQTFFHIRELEGPEREGDRWLVPRKELADGKIELTPMHETGCSVVQIDAPDFDLRRYAHMK